MTKIEFTENDVIEKNCLLADDIKANKKFFENIKNIDFCYKLYSALCSNTWIKNEIEYHFSWLGAATLVADLRENLEDSRIFYGSGKEGVVCKTIGELMESIGYSPKFFVKVDLDYPKKD